MLFRYRTGRHRQRWPEFTGLLEFRYDFGIGRVPVHVDNFPDANVCLALIWDRHEHASSRPRRAGSPQCFLQEALGRNRVTRGAKEEVDRSTGGIDRPI
jgi:hypothetical protein